MTTWLVLSMRLAWMPPASVPCSPLVKMPVKVPPALPLASSHTVPLMLRVVNAMLTVAGVGSTLPAASTAA